MADWVGKANAMLAPEGCTDAAVPRQSRSLPSTLETVMGRSVLFDMYAVPVKAFSGRPPFEGGLNRGSRHVPVHSVEGSDFSLSHVSL